MKALTAKSHCKVTRKKGSPDSYRIMEDLAEQEQEPGPSFMMSDEC